MENEVKEEKRKKMVNARAFFGLGLDKSLNLKISLAH